MKLQRDESGVEGVAIPKDRGGEPRDEKEIKIGKGFLAGRSGERIMVTEWTPRDQRDISHQRMTSG